MAQVQIQRPLRGSRISTFYPVKNLPALSSLDSAFQLQEYISLLIRLDVHDVESIVSIPGRSRKQKEKEKEGEEVAEKKVEVDEACWKYEQLRRLAQDLSHPLITMLQQVCTRSTCPEMKAGEWLYLCVAHGNDGAMEQCCAIDYILHTLDSATALLNSPRAFPSRLQIPPASHRHFTSLARRLGRIFAHAYFHHREEFEQAEAESSLYARFLALTEKFDLVPADFLVIPPRVGTSTNANRRDGVATTEQQTQMQAPVQEPTLLGAALQVNTQQDTHSPVNANAENSGSSENSPSGEDLVPASARRYGRSRTDTMMLEGEGRFPASPLSAAEEGPSPMGLETVLALAESKKEDAQAVEETTEVNDENDNDDENENDKSAEDAHSFIAQGLPEHDAGLESPTGTGTGLAPEPPSPLGDTMPEVTPSSSTAPPAKDTIQVIQVEDGVDGEVEVKLEDKVTDKQEVHEQEETVPEVVVEAPTPTLEEFEAAKPETETEIETEWVPVQGTGTVVEAEQASDPTSAIDEVPPATVAVEEEPAQAVSTTLEEVTVPLVSVPAPAPAPVPEKEEAAPVPAPAPVPEVEAEVEQEEVDVTDSDTAKDNHSA
ncbi:Mob1/phocein [Mycena amicta]|nr:Mob1/phocein [Mycena amicta]